MKRKYKMSDLIEKYYKQWIARPTPFGVGGDIECFYRLAKACIRYSRGDRKDGTWLRYFLEKDPANKFTEKDIFKAVSLFEHLLDFHYTDFPRPLVEMREPFIVKSLLERSFTKEEVEKIMSKEFGSDWEFEYRKKMGILPRNK